MEKQEANIKENVTLNGRCMTVEQFEEEKKSLTEKKIQVVNLGNNSYTTRLQD